MERTFTPIPDSRRCIGNFSFSYDKEVSDWSKVFPQDGKSVRYHWEGRKLVVDPTPVEEPAAEPQDKPEPGNAEALAEFEKELASASDPDLDTMRVELSMPRVKNETAAELRKRLLARKREILAK